MIVATVPLETRRTTSASRSPRRPARPRRRPARPGTARTHHVPGHGSNPQQCTMRAPVPVACSRCRSMASRMNDRLTGQVRVIGACRGACGHQWHPVASVGTDRGDARPGCGRPSHSESTASPRRRPEPASTVRFPRGCRGRRAIGLVDLPARAIRAPAPARARYSAVSLPTKPVAPYSTMSNSRPVAVIVATVPGRDRPFGYRPAARSGRVRRTQIEGNSVDASVCGDRPDGGHSPLVRNASR